jgi:antitoxin (DNA-binding transcriptional repressor) of toxin-antitoxin stability system
LETADEKHFRCRGKSELLRPARRSRGGEEIAVTRHGKVIARMVPDHRRVAADAFRDFWADADEIDLVAPEDKPAEDVASLDD